MSAPPPKGDLDSDTLPSPPHLDAVTYLYGHPLLNSLSPILHKTIYNHLGLNWTQIPLSTSSPPNPASPSSDTPGPYTLSPSIPTFLTQARSNPKFAGSSVTMPHKVAILPHLDKLTEEARGVGACNTIFLGDDSTSTTTATRKTLIGTNTDCIGIREALLQHTTPENRAQQGSSPALIVGGGGTARAAIYALRKYLHHSTIYIVNRDSDEVAAMMAEDEVRSTSTSNTPSKLLHITSPSEVHSLPPPSVIVSGIPNYPPSTPSEIQARAVLDAFLLTKPQHDSQPRLLLEMCYHPQPWTSIAEAGSRADWTVILGTEAMVWQGLEQARLWTGKDEVTTDVELVGKVKGVVADCLKEREESGS